jgi:hypothetical protein
VSRLLASGSENRARSIGLPFDQDGGCVVAEPTLLVLDDRAVEPAHRLGRRQERAVVPDDEVSQALQAEGGAVGRPAFGYSVRVEQNAVRGSSLSAHKGTETASSCGHLPRQA